MTQPPLVLISFIIVLALFIVVGIGVLIWLLYRRVPEDQMSEIAREIPLANVLGIFMLGLIAAICVTGDAYGLNTG